MRHPAFLALALVLSLAACGDDETPVPDATSDISGADAGTDTTGGADTSTDAVDDTADDATTDAADDASAGDSITFTLENANPGGLSRWVQVVDRRGVQGWYSVMPPGSLDEYYRANPSCTLCECGDNACEPCEPQPEIMELAPGETITGTWDYMQVEIDSVNTCETISPLEEDALQVEFVWSPNPPGADGTLPAGTLSRTRIRFNRGDADVHYAIEALAE